MHNLFLSLLLLLLLLLGKPACLVPSLKTSTAVAAAAHIVILSNTMPSPSDDAATNNTWGFLSLLLLLLLLLLGLPACLAQSLKDSTAVAAAHTVILSNTMASPSEDGATNNTWGPYASGKDFGVNMATVLVVLLCATALAFALHVAFRFLVHLLRRNRDRNRARAASPAGGEDDKPPAQLPGPVVSFSSGATRVAGAPECAICLAELAEGDRVRVLPPCSHGFHAQCVEAWLVGRSSCPTCRTDCRPPPEP